MARLNNEMKNAIRSMDLFPLATASSSGIPNVVPIKFVFIESDSELWFVDNFFNKTLQNMKNNPHAALYVYQIQEDICFQVKGELTLYTSGSNYTRMRKMVHDVRPGLPAKSLVCLHITDIYQCLPGNNAGAKIG